MLTYFGSKEKVYRTSPEELRKFSKKKRGGKKVRGAKSFGSYVREFSLRAGEMVTENKLTQDEHNYLFYSGLPTRVRRAIQTNLEIVMRRRNADLTKDTPPTMKETISAVTQYYNPNNIEHGIDSEEGSETSEDDADSSDDTDSDDDDNDEGSAEEGKKRRKKVKTKGKKAQGLEKELEEVREQLAQLAAAGRTGYPSTALVPFQGSHQPPLFQNQQMVPYPHIRLTPYSNLPQGRPYQNDPRTNVGVNQVTGLPYPNTQSAAPYQMVPRTFMQPGGFNSSAPYCFMCGKEQGQGLEHPLAMRNCPETHELINKGMVKYSPQGLLILSSGASIPRVYGPGNGGAAQVIREELSNRGGREVPPHQQVMSCNAMGLFMNNEKVLGSDRLAALCETAYAFPITRSQSRQEDRSPPNDLQKQVRFQVTKNISLPGSRSQSRASSPVPAWQKVYRPPTVRQPAEETRFSKISEPTAPQRSTAPHESNTEEGWRAVQKEKREERRDGQPAKLPLPYRFTSDIQEGISLESIQKQLLESKVTMSLQEILGISPELQKRLQAMVKTRREFGVKSGEWSAEVGEADEEVVQLCTEARGEALPQEAFMTWNKEGEDMHEVLERYANAVALGRGKNYAVPAGLIEGVFGSEKVTFLVDTGSELNLITRRVWEQSEVPIDEDGKRWSLRGIGGEIVPLLGCCRDAPVQIAGKNFDHHFFVSSKEHGAYDGILGQPWLSWFSTSIDSQRGGPTHLHAFPSGDKTGACASVVIVQADHPRSRDRLVLTGDHVYDGYAGSSSEDFQGRA